ncbi:MAG TPA: glycosyltransferase family 4 protein [Bryobacteraceae bacterium]|jgi:glycosyltransferase involved in cell wall biosynthesis
MAPLAPLDALAAGTENHAPAPTPYTGSVLIVGNFLSSAGRNRSVCEDLAERLSASGWTVVATSHRTGRLARLLDMLVAAWRTRKQYQVAQIDLFSGPAFFWAAAVCWLLRCLKKPYILTLHGGNLPAFSARWPRFLGALLRSAAAVTAPSGYLSEALQRFRSDILILPNAIDLPAYPFRARQTAAPRLIWLRAFHRIYQPSTAVRALALLAADFPDVRLSMAGPDKQDGSLIEARSLAEALGVAGRIDFSGRLPKAEIPLFLNQGDIFMNTSAVDNHPVTLLEAMACGACVVSTAPGGIPYLAKDRLNCLLVPTGDAQALAQGVSEILGKPKLAATLSQNARRAVEEYDWSVILPRWRELLFSAAHRFSGAG